MVVNRKRIKVYFPKISNLRTEREIKNHLMNLAEGFSESSHCLFFLAMTTKAAWDSMLIMSEKINLP